MSLVTNVMMSVSISEKHTIYPGPPKGLLKNFKSRFALFDEINRWLNEHKHASFGDAIDAGGEKGFEANVFAAAFNYFDTQGFLWYLRSLPWRDRAAVQVFVKEQEESTFKVYELVLRESAENPLTNNITKDFLHNVIDDPGRQIIDQLFDGVKGVFWVSRREADENMISMVARIIGGDALTAESSEGTLHVRFRGRLTKISPNLEPDGQYITLAALDEVIGPDYEIRFIKISDGGDKTAFMIFKRQQLSALDTEFGEKVGDALQPIASGTPYFARCSQYQAAAKALTRQYAELNETPPASFWNDEQLVSLGSQSVRIEHGEKTVTKTDRDYYATSLMNISNKRVRVKKFAGFMKSDGDYKLHTISGAWFSALDFEKWYGTSQGGWIKPGETVTDGGNFGGATNGFWAYWCENEDGQRFMAVSKHIDRLLPRWLAAAERGDSQAHYLLGYHYRQGEVVEQSDEKAVAHYLAAAKKGHDSAQCNLALMYINGQGLEQDYAAALHWLQRSAKSNNKWAQFHLGMAYKLGRGVPVNLADARSWLEKAAAQGHEGAKTELTNLS